MGRGAGRWFGERKFRFWLISGSWKLARDEGRFTSGEGGSTLISYCELLLDDLLVKFEVGVSKL